ncbi:hypothetical protein BU23DRAFT_553820 [Bimuria novae-zelandiae CBS 107.79]|uniref:Cora-domain-containing protein n=1 Tax=Bimuria novae-zelandiae CBS 107.79 TaxID=1447943 RepID=A0A6A5VAK1_9PLEO|nr:hypothetical protein BU23DRAFT_553820 [Bimuria novae-zelandiae CBS 107.79]
MQVSTAPNRWNELNKDPDDRSRRTTKTKLTYVNFANGSTPIIDPINDLAKLKETLQSLKYDSSNKQPMRLFIVEDLSQQVIEALGSRFDIDPLFWREQIEDYVWHNLRAPGAMPSNLMSDMRHRQWFRVRNLRLRYHESKDDFDASTAEVHSWNVLRRLDDDNNHWHWADKQGAIVSMLRTRTTIWIGKDDKTGGGTVGIVLLDPTVAHGTPLWYDRTNWLPVPKMTSTTVPDIKTSVSWYDDIIQITKLFPWFETDAGEKRAIDAQVITKPTLYTICAEWLVVCDYVKGRLSQIERELELPTIFRAKGDAIDSSLARLHTWRRAVPVFREMVTETLNFALPLASKLTHSSSPTTPLQPSTFPGFEDIAPDFQRILELLTDLQERVDRLSDVVASEISIEDSRRGLEDSRRANTEAHNMARVTWLATIFIPATFVSGLYSMNGSVQELRQTYWIYFVTALPFTLVVMAIGWVIGGGSLTPWRVAKADGGWRKDEKKKKVS